MAVALFALAFDRRFAAAGFSRVPVDALLDRGSERLWLAYGHRSVLAAKDVIAVATHRFEIAVIDLATRSSRT